METLHYFSFRLTKRTVLSRLPNKTLCDINLLSPALFFRDFFTCVINFRLFQTRLGRKNGQRAGRESRPGVSRKTQYNYIVKTIRDKKSGRIWQEVVKLM